MSLYAVPDTKLTAIAAAIREKDNGGVATVDEMPDRIRSITTGGRVQLSNNDVSTSVPNAIAFNCPFEPTNVFFSVNSGWGGTYLPLGGSAVIGGSIGVHMGTPFSERLRLQGAISGSTNKFYIFPESFAITKTYSGGVCTLQLAEASASVYIAPLQKYSIVAWE